MPRTRSISKDHESRLRRWRELHPDSDHHYHDLDTLEDLKSRNDVAMREDLRERPNICRGYPTFMTIGNTHKCNIECPMCFKQIDPIDNATWCPENLLVFHVDAGRPESSFWAFGKTARRVRHRRRRRRGFEAAAKVVP